MKELELTDKNNFSVTESFEVGNQDEQLVRKKKNKRFKPLIMISLFIIIFLVIIFIYKKFSNKPKYSTKKTKNPKKTTKPSIIQYISPYKKEGILDYLFYPYHSDIIRNLDDYEFLRDSLGKISLKMIFNSNYHGDYAIDVHSRANNKHLLALIETENGNRFGGYTSDNFTPQTFGLTSTSIELMKEDKSAFLFNLDSKKIFNIKPQEASKAVDCDDYITLCFGEKDLVLKNKFLTKGGISIFPGLYGDEKTQNFELTNGEKEFEVKTFEIYHVLFFSEFGDENNRMGTYKNFVN